MFFFLPQMCWQQSQVCCHGSHTLAKTLHPLTQPTFNLLICCNCFFFAIYMCESCSIMNTSTFTSICFTQKIYCASILCPLRTTGTHVQSDLPQGMHNSSSVQKKPVLIQRVPFHAPFNVKFLNGFSFFFPFLTHLLHTHPHSLWSACYTVHRTRITPWFKASEKFYINTFLIRLICTFQPSNK